MTEKRVFESGAFRDTNEDKLNFFKALDPLVLETYVKYLGKHRTMPDGTKRQWDNWKQGIPKEVYAESLNRHNHDVWKLMQGYEAYDNHGSVTLIDALCGVLFNAQGLLYEILKEDREPLLRNWIETFNLVEDE